MQSLPTGCNFRDLMRRRSAAAAVVLLTLGMLLVLPGCGRAARSPMPGQERAPDTRLQLEGLPLAAAGAIGEGGLYVSDFMTRLFGGAPGYLQHARTLADPAAQSDELRRAINGLLRYRFGRQEPYTAAYRQLAENAPDPLLRATAVRAINRSRDAEATATLLAGLEDPSRRVRLEAAKALNRLPHRDALAPLLERALDEQEDRDVRIAAAEALRHYENPDLIRGLARLVGGPEFSVAWQARQSLIVITGQDHGFDPAAWARLADA